MSPRIPHIEDMHRLTKRQLEKCFPDGKFTEEGWGKFVQLVNQSYQYSEQEMEVNRRAEQISREEYEEINKELAFKNEFLDSFNHGLAHDIKNHTTNLEGLIQMLFKYEARDDRSMMKDIMSRLHLSINQMSSILRGFLYLSRAESKIDSQYTIIDSEQLTEEIALETSWLQDDVAHEIRYEFQLNELFFSFHILRIILVNLISNSLKFSKQGQTAEIDVSLIHNNGQVKIVVKDNGVGMDMKAAGNKLLSLFGKADNNARGAVGFGIGLFIVKKILERHNGNIDIQSEINQGSSITITLEVN